MVTIALLSQKGGVAKTLTATNLAAALTARRHRVLLVDFDPQADLSAGLGFEDPGALSIEGLLTSQNLVPPLAMHQISGPASGLAVLPTTPEGLLRLTARLLAGDGDDLARLLGEVGQGFEIVIIDTPAGDTVFGRQALVAADLAIVPMLPGFHELRAMTRALDLIEGRAREEATHLGLLGVLLVNADQRWRSTKEYTRHLASMDAADEFNVFETVIPRHQPVADHPRYGLPTVWLRPRCSVAVAYRDLADEVLARLDADHGVRLTAHAGRPAAASR